MDVVLIEDYLGMRSLTKTKYERELFSSSTCGVGRSRRTERS